MNLERLRAQEILELEEKLATALDHFASIAQILVGMSRSKIEDREWIELVTKQGLNCHHPVKVVVLDDQAQEPLASKLVVYLCAENVAGID